uniref:Exocyst complex component n=2 Tax=Pseudictyota dubia TaxID=2749911 RepID=A0A7R9W467_9STRA
MGVEKLSILPTDPNFDPLLFLTLVHRNASFEQLQHSIGRLESKTDNQVQRLQNLVRDNFALFVRCADGIDLFALDGDSKRNRGKPGVKDRLDKLDALSESCSYQAKKSFKPLLDNTNEVRKVQSALAVLQRVGPLLQVPNLMRQHIEHGRFSAAVKAYRRVLVIEADNKVELLRHVKLKAAVAAREARRDLEATLANHSVPVTNLLDAIRDLGELIELNVPPDPKKGEEKEGSPSAGVFTVGDHTINVRDHFPALSCLLLQAAYFSSFVDKSVRQADNSTQRIYNGESVSAVTEEASEKKSEGGNAGGTSGAASQESGKTGETKNSKSSRGRNSSNRWKYDILEARVVSTIRAVGVARNWLPRLLQIGVAAREAETRRAARAARRRGPSVQDDLPHTVKAYDVFVKNISPSIITIVEHATFCALGCSNSNTGEDIKMTFGTQSDQRLQALLRAPLPPAQSAKCAKELAELVEVVHEIAASAETLRLGGDGSDLGRNPISSPGASFGSPPASQYNRGPSSNPLELCVALADDAVVTVERRRCIYAFDVCARTCASRASGSGTFDGDALLSCVQKLTEELTRADDCANEVEKGCELVVRRCCEGLASYVRDRGDAARLRAVAECADALNGRIVDVVREVAYLTNGQCETVEEALAEDIMSLEASMFDEFLDNICRHVAGCTKLGSMSFDRDDDGSYGNAGGIDAPKQFPAYLSACLLAIVRCRAQVERALGDTTIRRSQGITYQYLAMATAADGVVAGICYELNERMARMTASGADRFANELQFLMNTLKKYLSDDMLSVAENCRRMLCAKAGHLQGDGPDGLAAIEELERLGRVYVLCLGE